jgi:hypothetical protein
MPRVAARAEVTAPRRAGAPEVPPEIERAWRDLNAAYASSLAPDHPPRWPWFLAVYELDRPRGPISEEAKLRKRRGNLIRRMRRRFPLAAEAMIRAELERRPEYYGLTPEEARAWKFEGEP